MRTVHNWPDALFLLNCVLSLAGTLLLVCRMNRLWARLGGTYRAIHLVLLFHAINVAGASLENVVSDAEFGWHHLGSTATSASLVVTVCAANWLGLARARGHGPD